MGMHWVGESKHPIQINKGTSEMTYEVLFNRNVRNVVSLKRYNHRRFFIRYLSFYEELFLEHY